jgi:hypothetical protein
LGSYILGELGSLALEKLGWCNLEEVGIWLELLTCLVSELVGGAGKEDVCARAGVASESSAEEGDILSRKVLEPA